MPAEYPHPDRDLLRRASLANVVLGEYRCAKQGKDSACAGFAETEKVCARDLLLLCAAGARPLPSVRSAFFIPSALPKLATYDLQPENERA